MPNVENKVIDWINDNIFKDVGNNKLQQSEIENVLHFSLLWNLFEAIFWTTTRRDEKPLPFSLAEVIECAKKYSYLLDDVSITPIFCYLHTRYQDNENFKLLKFRNSKSEKAIESKLETIISCQDQITLNDKVYFIAAVVYRFRNNLFHGEKSMIKIKYQEENFINANKFLMHFIENAKPR